MSASTPSRTQAERADQTRTRILDAAVREFSENGLAGARTEQIAEAAGVNKALLYYYFKGKNALYAAALEWIAEGVRDSSMAVLEADASAGERFLRATLEHFDRIHSDLAGIWWVAYSRQCHNDSVVRKLHLRFAAWSGTV